MSATTSTKERPIIMQAHSVRAILDGTKTQTRRVVKPQPWVGFEPHPDYNTVSMIGTIAGPQRWGFFDGIKDIFCPYGRPGDRLYAKERFSLPPGELPGVETKRAAGGVCYGTEEYADGRVWRSPLFMPRRLSRLTLEITDVRVQQVQDISEADAIAEGAGDEMSPEDQPTRDSGGNFDYVPLHNHRFGFRNTWDLLNAARGFPWASNPWVWAITFKVSA